MRFSGFFWSGLIGVVSVLGVSSASAAPADHTVVYRVLGVEGANVAIIRYQTRDGEVEDNAARLPWSSTVRIPAADLNLAQPGMPQESVGLYVTRTESDTERKGLFTCQIWVDGKLLEEATRDALEGSLECYLGDSNDNEA